MAMDVSVFYYTYRFEDFLCVALDASEIPEAARHTAVPKTMVVPGHILNDTQFEPHEYALALHKEEL